MALKFEMGRALVSVALLGLASVQACGGGDDDPPLTTSTGATSSGPTGKPVTGGIGGGGGEGADTGTGGTAATGGNAGEPAYDALAPLVEITSPEALDSPNDGDVLIAGEVDVVCLARPSLEPGAVGVDTTSVIIEVLDADGEVVQSDNAEYVGGDEYTASVILADVDENGPIGFRCSASDAADPVHVGTGSAWTFIDHGPSVTAENPQPDSIHPREAMNFEFTVEPDPVADDDDGAEIESVTFSVAGTDFEADVEDEGRYIVPIDLEDPVLFPNLPTGEIPVTITAANRRTERVVSYIYVVDGEGPEIKIGKPAYGDVVGRKQVIEFSIHDDLSPIDPASVVLLVNGEDGTVIRYDPNDISWERIEVDDTTEEYKYTLDTSRILQSQWQSSFSVRAADLVGKESLTRSVLVYLDYVPPLIDLDPPNVRQLRDSGRDWECSGSFDPAGDDALSDLMVVRASPGRFRAIVWELTNEFGQDVSHMSGLDESSVQLFVNPELTVPLLVDTNEDGLCDDIQADILNDGIDLFPVTPAGTPWFGTTDYTVYPEVPADPTVEFVCHLPLPAEPPDTLCVDHASEMARAISHTAVGRPPVIFAPGVDQGLDCTGTELEMRLLFGKQPEGWLCAAVRAVDFAENHSVSRPLRVCWDDPQTAEDPCVDAPSGAPACVSDCTPPGPFVLGDNIFNQ